MGTRPRTYRVEAIVIRRRNMGEADSIFTLFTRQHGKIDGIAKGVRKAKSRMRGHVEPLTRVKLLLAQGRSLDVITQAEAIDPHRNIREDLDRTALALHSLELIDRLTALDEPHLRIYDLASDYLRLMNNGAAPVVTRYFELALLAELGYEVQVGACAECGGGLAPEPALLSPVAGGLLCSVCRPEGTARVISVDAIKVLRFAATTDIYRFARLQVGTELATELATALRLVLRYQLDRDTSAGQFLDEVARYPSVSRPPETAV